MLASKRKCVFWSKLERLLLGPRSAAFQFRNCSRDRILAFGIFLRRFVAVCQISFGNWPRPISSTKDTRQDNPNKIDTLNGGRIKLYQMGWTIVKSKGFARRRDKSWQLCVPPQLVKLHVSVGLLQR